MIPDQLLTDLSVSSVLLITMWYWFQRLDTKFDNLEGRVRRVEDKVDVHTLEEKHLNSY